MALEVAVCAVDEYLAVSVPLVKRVCAKDWHVPCPADGSNHKKRAILEILNVNYFNYQ